MQNNSWSWRKLLQLKAQASKFLEMRNVFTIWKYYGSKYCVAKVWKELRPSQNKVTWHRLLWSNLVIPKHTVIAWMAVLNRLPTMDRLVAWSLADSGNCRLCQDGMETKDHLFFGCCYSRAIWRAILNLCGLRREVHNWKAKLKWAIQKLKCRSLVTLILRIAWQVFIYFIWREMNQKLYTQKSENGLHVLEQIKSTVRIKTSRLCHVADDPVNRSLCQSWGLSILV